MIRYKLSAVLIALTVVGLPHTCAGQGTPGAPKTDSAKPGDTKPAPPVTSSGVMQLKKLVTGDFSYRFVSPAGKAGASAGAPVPLPTPPATDNIVAIPIPSTVNLKDGLIEVLDNGHGNIARIPVTTKGVADLAESSFTLAQRINVPVQSKGLGVIGAQVTLTNVSKKYSQSRLLQPDDNGIARFDAAPLNEPLTVNVSYGSNPAESQTKTLTAARPADAWPAIAVTWPDAKTVAAPAPVAPAAAANTAQGEPERGRRSYDDEPRGSRQPEGNPLNSIVSTVVSLMFLAAVGYGVFWAYKTGRLKDALDKLGINTGPVAAGVGGMPDPFKPTRAPVQPITEGTADPFAGGGPVGIVGAAPIADGPRLVATAGSYAGNIFPINVPSADIGRDAGNTVALPNDTNASRRHATIQSSAGQFVLVDNASSNGTFVNGVRVASQTPQTLRPGDEVQIGLTRFRFEA